MTLVAVSVSRIEDKRDTLPRRLGLAIMRPATWATTWARNTPVARATNAINKAIAWIARKSPTGQTPYTKNGRVKPRNRIVEKPVARMKLDASFAIVTSFMSTG